MKYCASCGIKFSTEVGCRDAGIFICNCGASYLNTAAIVDPSCVYKGWLIADNYMTMGEK